MYCFNGGSLDNQTVVFNLLWNLKQNNVKSIRQSRYFKYLKDFQTVWRIKYVFDGIRRGMGFYNGTYLYICIVDIYCLTIEYMYIV